MNFSRSCVDIKYTDTGNFDDSSSAPVTQTVSRATLTVTADDQSMVYGSALPVLTVSYRGFVNEDTAGVLSGSPTLTAAATAGSDVGSYIKSDTRAKCRYRTRRASYVYLGSG